MGMEYLFTQDNIHAHVEHSKPSRLFSTLNTSRMIYRGRPSFKYIIHKKEMQTQRLMSQNN
jgi:hypothetical protein